MLFAVIVVPVKGIQLAPPKPGHRRLPFGGVNIHESGAPEHSRAENTPDDLDANHGPSLDQIMKLGRALYFSSQAPGSPQDQDGSELMKTLIATAKRS